MLPEAVELRLAEDTVAKFFVPFTVADDAAGPVMASVIVAPYLFVPVSVITVPESVTVENTETWLGGVRVAIPPVANAPLMVMAVAEPGVAELATPFLSAAAGIITNF